MRYLLLLLLASCAAPSGRVLERGTYPVRPPPPAQRPGVGAPSVGQPGAMPRLPRSPYTRVLPQTPETMRQPGLWAGEQPVASARSFTPPLLMEAFHALPDDGQPSEHGVVNSCAANLRLAADAIGATADAANIPQRTRRCLVARLLWMCVDYDLRRYETAHDKMRPVAYQSEGLYVLSRTERHLIDMVRKECAGVHPTANETQLMNDVFTTWKEDHDV